jgi:hypothetical protein
MSKIFVDQVDPKTGTSLTLGTSGDTVNIPSGVTIANAGTATGFGEVNTPAFSVQLGNNQSQSVSDNVITKVQLDDEYFDTDSAFDTSTYRFTVPSGKAGKYFFSWGIYLYQATVSNLQNTEALLYLNGSRYIGANFIFQNSYARYHTHGSQAFLNLSVGDYIEIFGTVNSVNGAGSPEFFGGDRATFLTGFRVTT